MTIPHYHVYCDEAGQFEEDQYHEKSLVFGLLVPDEHKNDLAMRYSLLKRKHLNGVDFVHGKDLYKRPEYERFLNDLVPLTCESPMKLVCIRYDHDILKHVAGDVSEAIACNRYLYMIQALMDTVLFLHPPLWIPVTDWTFKHNTRVFPVKCNETAEHLKALGYKTFTDNKDPAKQIVHVWDTAGFMVYLKRRLADFSPYHRIIGARTIKQAAMQTASKSNDPFVDWADNLAGVLLWKNNPELAHTIGQKLDIDAVYGNEHAAYQQLVMTFLDGRFDTFLPQALKQAAMFKTPYYTRQTSALITRAFDHMDLGPGHMKTLAAMIRNQIETSSGQWELVSNVTEKLIEKLSKKQLTPDEVPMLKSLTMTRMSCLNHRGQADAAEALAQDIETEPSLTVDDLRHRAEMRNRLAVTGANRFDFIAPAKALLPYLKSLNHSRRELSTANGHELKDPLIGHLASTTAQAFAFMAPVEHRYFDQADRMFDSARKDCVTPEDDLRQAVYLAHLHLDMDRYGIPSTLDPEQRRFNLASETIRAMAQRPEVAALINHPAPGAPLSMAFVLVLFLKYECQTGEAILPDTLLWMAKHNTTCFGHCIAEHPFELIFCYLGQIAFKRRDIEKAEAFFNTALTIPMHITTAPPVIKAIHCQVIGIWARCLLAIGNHDEAMEKINAIVFLMNPLGDTPENRTIVTADGGGWFGATVKALDLAAKNRTGVAEALEAFLSRFTFNYR